MKSCYLFLLTLLFPVLATGQAQMDLPVTFDDAGIVYGVADFGGNASGITTDPADATNMVVQSVKTAGAMTWGGTTLTAVNDGGADGFATPIPFSTSASIISVRVWSPAAGTPVLLKAEKTDDDAVSVETLTSTTVAGEWETLEFDFNNEAPGTAAINYDAVYGKLSIFFNFGTSPAADETYYWDDVVFTSTTGGGGGGGMEVGPLTAAPTPTHDAAEVISLFSDAYTNVAVDTFRADFGAGDLTDTLIEGNSTLLYRGLSFTGIETLGENAIDLEAAGMTHLHLDFWSGNSTTFGMKLVDFGGDGFGGDNDTEAEIQRNLAQGQWVSVDYPLPAFAGMNQSDISQLIISSAPGGASDVYLDNIYFYQGEALGAQMDLPVNFDEAGIDYGLVDFGGNVSMIVADPEDASNTVAQSVKTAGAATWAGTTLTSSEGGPVGFASSIPFAPGASTMSVRVWSPTAGTPVRMKVEKADDTTISVETEVLTTVAAAWDTLTFDFANEAIGTAAINYASVYEKASIFFNFGTEPTEEATYYWDDIVFGGAGGNGGGGEVGTHMDLPVTFDDSDVDYGLVDFGGNESAIVADPEDATNTVAQSTKTAGAMTWGGTTLTSTEGGPDGFASPVPFTPEASTMSVRVWSPAAGTPVLLKAENTADGTISVETLASTTVAGAWETLVFDFSNENPGTSAIDYGADYGKVSIFFNFGTSPVEAETYYWDDVVFGSTVGTGTPVVGLLEVFPNPVKNRVNIIAPERMTDLTLLDVNGRVVSRHQPEALRFDLDMSQLKPGFYVALATTAEGTMTVKLLKE